MSSILRKFKLREQTQSTDKATFVIRNGQSVLKELIRASNGPGQLSWILRKLKRRRESADKTTFMTRNGETVLKELIAASNVFESAEYGTLADRLHCCGDHFEALSMTDRLKIAMDIAHAVAYLHVGFPRNIWRNFPS